MGLTLRRAVQIQEAIYQREDFRNWESLRITEWQTQSLAAMIANTVEDKKARETLYDVAHSLSLTGSGIDKQDKAVPTRPTKKKKTYKLVDGTEIEAKDLKNYEYDEIDHSEEERTRKEATRKQNSGKNLTDVLGSFSKK